jgi:TorA maturation chaperone TorD
MPAPADSTRDVAEEELLRANIYGLLSRLLRAAPKGAFLSDLGKFRSDGTAFGDGLGRLGEAARTVGEAAIDDEYHALFIGLGQGELVPYASYYRTGFLNEKPLAELRGDMASLGIARAEGVAEPEDHIASLCEMMGGLSLGAFGRPVDLSAQRLFFDTHLAPWGSRFFTDLEAAAAADFYRPVGTIGRLFFDIESKAFALAA